MGWLANLTLEDEARKELGLPRAVCEYEDIFSDEPSGLPQHRDVDFTIDLHPSTSPISMTSLCMTIPIRQMWWLMYSVGSHEEC